MNRKTLRGIYSRPMDAAAQPIIENSRLPTMSNIAAPMHQLAAAESPLPLMDSTYRPDPNGHKPLMAPFVAAQGKVPAPPTGGTYQAQMPKSTRTAAAASSYVVLRMRVQNGTMSVIGSRKVAGPLLIDEALVQNGLTYEAMLEGKRLAIGSIADFGEQRSYPRPGEHEHHITILPSFDFNLRIPGNQLTLPDLAKLQVSLYRFKEPVHELKLDATPLQSQYAQQIRVVAELHGIQVNQLAGEVQEMVRRTFAPD